MNNIKKEELLKDYCDNMKRVINDISLDGKGIMLITGIMKEVAEALETGDDELLSEILEPQN